MQLNQLSSTDNKLDSKTNSANPGAVDDQSGDRLLSSYDYELPEQLIAQNPVTPRDSARLLVVDSPNSHAHRLFRDVTELLKPGDLLVLNNTRVIPARLYGRKISGASVEVLLLEEQQPNIWLALVKPGKRLLPGAKIIFTAPQDSNPENLFTEDRGKGENGDKQSHAPSPIPHAPCSNPLCATVLSKDETTGGRILQFDVLPGRALTELLEQYGHVPLPPYISQSEALPERYQTVYAQTAGSSAAPTAGLHFTTELLQKLSDRGIEQAFVTLHIGVGTFRPVEVEDVTTHKMHSEWVEVSPETVDKIRQTKAKGGRVIAVGTTAVRSLEGAAAASQTRETSQQPIPYLAPFCGKTELFIYPGYQWRVVDGLITNFHLPRSSLLMLVSALVGRQRLLQLYREAIAQQYRFYSFGDAMLILPEAGSRDIQA